MYELADGRKIKLDITTADIEFMGELVGGTVIFGEADAEPLLGVTALKSVGIEIDPLNQRLKRIPAVRLKSVTAVTTPDRDKEQRGMTDEIMKELWEIKDNIAREHGYDVRRIVAHLQTKQRPRVIRCRSARLAFGGNIEVTTSGPRGRSRGEGEIERRVDDGSNARHRHHL